MSLNIAIPSSIISDVSHLRDKTKIVGQIGRAAAIFRVDRIYIFQDGSNEANIIRLILSYLETPQYLRKRLFGKRPELRYVGLLPPLRTPHHPLEKQSGNLRRGEFREGVVLYGEKGEFLVDIGVERPLRAKGRAPSIGSRATVKVTEVHTALRGRFVGKGEVDPYWGYNVHISGRGLAELVLGKDFDLTIAASRHGRFFQLIEDRLRERWRDRQKVLVAFGSNRRGLGEILAEEGLTIDGTFNFVINTIPWQGCETVRTEEAIYATLAVLNILSR